MVYSGGVVYGWVWIGKGASRPQSYGLARNGEVERSGLWSGFVWLKAACRGTVCCDVLSYGPVSGTNYGLKRWGRTRYCGVWCVRV